MYILWAKNSLLAKQKHLSDNMNRVEKLMKDIDGLPNEIRSSYSDKLRRINVTDQWSRCISLTDDGMREIDARYENAINGLEEEINDEYHRIRKN